MEELEKRKTLIEIARLKDEEQKTTDLSDKLRLHSQIESLQSQVYALKKSDGLRLVKFDNFKTETKNKLASEIQLLWSIWREVKTKSGKNYMVKLINSKEKEMKRY